MEIHLNSDAKTCDSNKINDELAEMCPETKVMLWDGCEFQQFEAEYLNQVYPEKINKATVSDGVEFLFHFLGSSLHYWVELHEAKTPDPGKLSKKDIKFIKDELTSDQQDTIQRWSAYFNEEPKFRAREKEQEKFVPPGKKVHSYQRGDMEFEVCYARGDDKEFIPYKERFEILLLLFVDGASFTENEAGWHYYIVYKLHEGRRHFVGLLSKYEFRITYNRQRDRISQVLILPPFQKQGHGKELLDLVYEESLKNDNVFEITVQGPSFQFQCLRDSKEAEMLLKAEIFKKQEENALPMKTEADIKACRQTYLKPEIIRSIKQKLKLPGHQIERIVNMLVYSHVLKSENDMLRSIFEEQLRKKTTFDRSAFKSRKKKPYLHVQGEEVDIKMFLLERVNHKIIQSKQEMLRNRAEIEDILAQNLDGYRRVILKLSKASLL